MSSPTISKIIESRLLELEQMLLNPTIKFAYTKKDKFYQFFDNFSIEEINDALEKLSNVNKNIIIDYYELNDSTYYTYNSLAKKYNVSPTAIAQSIKNSIHKINLILNKKNNNNARFNELYKNYDEKDVNFALACLPEKKQEILKSYYGLDKHKEISIKEISLKFNTSESYIHNLIYISHQKISETLKNLDNFETLFHTFKNENIYEIIDKLNHEEQKIITQYIYSSSVKDFLKAISKNKKITIQETIEYCQNIENKAKEIIKAYVSTNKNKDVFKKIFEGYSAKNIHSALSALDERRRNIVKLYYGLEGNKSLTMQEIGDIYGLTRSRINEILKNSIKRMCILLEIPRNQEDKIDLNYLFIHTNHSKFELNCALMYFSQRNQDILCSKLGLNGYKRHGEKYIAEKHGITEEGVNTILSKSAPTLINILNNNIDYILDNKIVELLKKYDLQNVMWAIEQLDISSQRLFCMHYGICGYKKHSLKQLSEQTNIDELALSIDVDNTYEEIVSRINYKQKKEQAKTKQEQFFNKLITKDKYKINVALRFLEKNEVEMLNIYFNLDKKKAYTKKEILSIFNITEKDLNEQIEKIINKINSKLSNNLVKKR